MLTLNGAWRAIRRFIVRTNTPDATPQPVDPHSGWTRAVDRCNGALRNVRAVSRQLHDFYGQIREQVEETQRNRELVWQDLMRKDRRANRRALILLTRLLSPEQRQEFRKSGYFHVVGGASGDRYRIRADMVANIDALREDGAVKYRLCILPTGGVPLYDVMAAQLLHLQDPGTEQTFLQQANVYPPHRKVELSRSVWIA